MKLKKFKFRTSSGQQPHVFAPQSMETKQGVPGVHGRCCWSFDLYTLHNTVPKMQCTTDSWEKKTYGRQNGYNYKWEQMEALLTLVPDCQLVCGKFI